VYSFLYNISVFSLLSLEQPCTGCAAPYGYHNVMSLSQDTSRFAVSSQNEKKKKMPEIITCDNFCFAASLSLFDLWFCCTLVFVVVWWWMFAAF